MPEIRLTKKIKNRKLTVYLNAAPSFGRKYYEVGFIGSESEKLAFQEHKIPDQVIKMWEPRFDPNNIEAERVFAAAVDLLQKGEPLEVVYITISALVQQIFRRIEK